MTVEDLKNVRAKSDGTTLVAHTYAVMKTGLEIIRRLALPEEQKERLKRKFIIAAILHDLGKVHPWFQKRLNGDKEVDIRHELVSLWFCVRFLKLDGDILFAIATHHKSIEGSDVSRNKCLSLLDLTNFDNLYNESAGTMELSTLENWLKLFPLEHISCETVVVDTLTVDHKVIKTLRRKAQPRNLSVGERKDYSLLRALLQAADHIASAETLSVIHYEGVALEKIQPGKNDSPLPFRHFQEVLKTWISDLILCAPTGSGKTVAALIWVYANQSANSRLIYVLPYTASINAMAKYLKRIFGEKKVTVQHSKSLGFIYDELVNEASACEPDYRKLGNKAKSLNSLGREIYYPVKVTTLHQILRIPFYGRGWEFAALDYHNALFIIDEFHTYNALLTGMMLGTVRLFRRLFHAKFMFLSATIPDFLLKKLITEVYDGDERVLLRPDSRFDSDAAVMNRKRHRLVCHAGEDIIQWVPEIEKRLQQGLSVLVVVNNVRTCQQIYQAINFDKDKKSMLHGGFNLKSRKEIEEAITNEDKSKRPRLLVATQAVEVSLNIDYNEAFIENAPIDVLIQRFGRINRDGGLCCGSGNKITARIHLFEKIHGRTPFYDDGLLRDTWNCLSALDGRDLSEDDLTAVCNKVYKDGYTEAQSADFNQGLLAVKDFEKDWLAGYCTDRIDDFLNKSNQQKVDVLCSNLEDEYRELIGQKRFIEANELLVSVYPYYTTDLKPLPGGKSVLVAKDLFYDSQIGFTEKGPDCRESKQEGKD